MSLYIRHLERGAWRRMVFRSGFGVCSTVHPKSHVTQPLRKRTRVREREIQGRQEATGPLRFKGRENLRELVPMR